MVLMIVFMQDNSVPTKTIVVNLAMQIAHAVKAIHDEGVAHRDLKPENIMVSPDGKIKIFDFGTSKSAAASGPWRTQVGTAR
jgi:serine/threonine protein kinase